jgi:hypothetical protein
MPLLHTKSKRESHKLVGVSLPSPIHDYMTLYSLAKSSSKSKIFKDLLVPWVERAKERDSETSLLNGIIQRINTRWKLEKASKARSNFEGFKEQVILELTRKGLSEDNILYITNRLKV